MRKYIHYDVIPPVICYGLTFLIGTQFLQISPLNRLHEVIERQFSKVFALAVHDDIMIVDIDSTTIELVELQPPGIPKRSLLAEVIRKISLSGAKVIVVDLLMNEEDQLPSENLAITEVARISNVVQSLNFGNVTSPQISNAPPSDITLEKFAVGKTDTFLIEFLNASDAQKPFPDLRHAAQHAGHIVILRKPNSKRYTHFPVALNYNGFVIPSLSLQSLRLYYDVEPTWTSEAVVLCSEQDRSAKIPFYNNAIAEINFLDYRNLIEHTEHRLTFAQVLHKPLNSLSIFRGKIVIIGSSVGSDTFKTPNFDKYPGWLIHTSIINSVLQDTHIRTTGWGGFVLAILNLIAFHFFLARLRQEDFWKFAPLICFGLLIFVNLVGAIFFVFGWILNMGLPNITIFLIFAAFVVRNRIRSKTRREPEPDGDEEESRNLVFISYAREDELWLKKLLTHCKPLERQIKLKMWVDINQKKGVRWEEELEKALTAAKVAVLLVSPNYLASDFIIDRELNYFLEAAEDGNVAILWVPVSDSLYEKTKIKEYQAVIDPSRPLDKLSLAKQREALTYICKKIEETVNSQDMSKEK